MSSKKKRGLGKGLDALLASTQAAPVSTQATPSLGEALPGKSSPGESSQPMAVAPESVDGELRHLPIEWIQPGRYQPRRDIQQEALEELAASIKAQGLMQPIVVRLLEGQTDRFEIIAGERRWRACQLAQLDKIPALIRTVPDEAAIAMALIENIQREDLNPMEEAIALHRLQEEFELTQMQVAEAVGKSRTTVTNLLRLMNLTPDVKRLLEHGDIEMGHAKALLGLQDQQQSEAAREVVAKGMTVRQTESLVRNRQAPVVDKPQSKPSADIQRLERMLGERLGANVNIQHSAKGKGKLVINYSDLDELDGILAHIR